MASKSDRKPMRVALSVACGALLAIGAASFFVHSGIYNIAADTPHMGSVYWLMQTVRNRSIAAHAKDVVVPQDLSDPRRITSGAGQYAEMCSGCHLAPGMKRTEISRGLYPRAPELRRGNRPAPAEDFWVVKHGVKMSGMPAWGLTHDDAMLWDVVAFLRKLPELSPEQYESLVKSAPKTHEEMMRTTRGQSEDDHAGHQEPRASPKN